MGNGGSTRAILDAWRERDADRIDPVRFHFIEALERRAADHRGEPRRILDGRLSRLIEAYADDLERTASSAADADGAAVPDAPARGALGRLVDHLASQAAAHGGDSAAEDTAPRPCFPELAALDDFRNIWSRIRTEGQVRQSLEQAPRNAGPLNSGRLVHRSLTLMRELSPGYLQQFLAYVDTLSWMEQMNQGTAFAPGTTAPAAAAPRKRARSSRT